MSFLSLLHLHIALGLEFPDDNSTSAIHTITGTGGTISNHTHHDIIGSSGGRNRAFSFECFAFGINADEPLPPLEQPQSSSIMNVTPMTSMSSSSTMSQKGILNNNDTSILNSYDSHSSYNNSNNNNNNNNALYDVHHPQVPEQRPRGDSIIFDPASFQDGGIHELLPGLIEQQQQQRQGNDFTSASPSATQFGVANHVPSSQQYKQQPPQRMSYSQPPPPQVKPLPSRPPPVAIVQNKRQHQPMVTTSSTVPCIIATSTSSATTSQQPMHSQHRKSSATGTSTSSAATTASAAQQQSQQQDMVTTINSDGTTTTISLEMCNKDGRIGIYLPEARIARIARFHAKRSNRIWRKRIKYDCRKKLADSRPRIKGRFVKRTDMDE